MKRTVKQNPDIQLMNTKEFIFSQKMTEQAIWKIEESYNKIGHDVYEVVEYVCTQEDIEQHIDATFHHMNNISWNLYNDDWQIKVLDQWRFKENFTIEYEQNRHTGELGEISHIMAKYYFHGYSQDHEYITEYHIINVPRFIDWFHNMPKREREGHIRFAGCSRASFFWYPYAELPKGIIVGKG